MTMSKESQRVEQRLTEADNALARIEAKLDALMGAVMKPEDLKKIKLPEPKKIEKISSAQPYIIKEQPVSTTEVPESKAADEFVPSMPTPDLEHMDTTEAPVTPTADSAPIAGYDNLTEGEAIKLIKGMTVPAEKQAILAYEAAHKNRARVIEAGSAEATASA